MGNGANGIGDKTPTAWDETSIVSVRLKNSLIAIVDDIQQRDTHKNRTDIIEQAVRDWCERELQKNGQTLLGKVDELKKRELERGGEH